MTQFLEAGIQALVDDFISNGKPCPSRQNISDRRAGYVSSTVLAGKSPAMAEEFLDTVNGIPVKVYKPTKDLNLPITVYFHGGCFISGGFDTHDAQLRQIAASSNTIVICIQYRLAPEFTYPAAHDDVYQAVLGIKTCAHQYGGDADNMVFVGDSAGGQLALATTLRLKTLQSWLPRKQILIYPMLDPQGQSESYRENATDYIITANMLLSGFEMYAKDASTLKAAPELNVLSADLSGLPSTSIITAEFDPLRDEGEQLYKALLAQGVEAYCERYLGVIHGFFQLSGVSESAKRCIESISSQIRR
ncbi:alpha/beta hydrolase [Enterovibrio coralii]|uniref:Lipase n=1 Tax=Enterovibrio coralii TaxID=294935 RepID=A0A135IA47_9GAMM|nr:alpha/beta hydrolase [Enterovibrio coralii]KXF82307.1 lipase [Enterovibrio coralii]